jgi:glycosyltransferase involved in cell wall biosynthesis
MTALDALGVPVTWTPVEFSGSRHTVVRDYRGPMAHLAHRPVDHDVVVVQMPLNGALELVAGSRGRRLISVTAFETDRPPAGWVAASDDFDTILVPSAFNRDVLLAAGVRAEVRAVPHIVGSGSGAAPARYPDIGDRFVFYTIGSWSTRKAMPDTINAFLDAFTARDDVALVVKTTGRDQQAVDRWARGLAPRGPTRWPVATWPAVAALLAGRRDVPRLHLVAESLSAREIDALHARGDCFFSLTRAEGWGLCISDALAAGNPAVVTGWSAPVDYLGPDYPLFVDADLVPTADETPDGWFERGKGYRWARARHDHAVDLLRWVAAHRDEAAAVGRAHGRRLAVAYGPERVGRTLLAALSGGSGVA